MISIKYHAVKEEIIWLYQTNCIFQMKLFHLKICIINSSNTVQQLLYFIITQGRENIFAI